MKLQGYQVTHRSRSSCTIRKRSWSEWRRRKTHSRAQSLHVPKSLIQLQAFGLELFLHLGVQYFIAWLEYKTSIFNNQGTTNETEITFSAAI